MKKTMILAMATASLLTASAQAAQLTCEWDNPGERVVAEVELNDFAGAQTLKDISYFVNERGVFRFTHKGPSIRGQRAPRANANIFVLPGGYGDDRNLYLPRFFSVGAFHATVIVFEDGLEPKKTVAFCNVQ